MAKNTFKETTFSAFSDINARSIVVIGGRSFLSKKESECYVIDIVSKHKCESVFVDKTVFDVINENGCGEYTVWRDDRGRIDDIDFSAPINDCLV